MSEKIWSDDAWEDYLYWQTQDKKTLKRINQLIQDIQRNGCMNGIGKPEPLSGDLQGEYSRRINEKDRLVYHMENGRLYIAHCRGHYGDKKPQPIPARIWDGDLSLNPETSNIIEIPLRCQFHIGILLFHILFEHRNYTVYVGGAAWNI